MSAPIDPPPTLRRPGRHAVVIGHRGASADVPENTLPAFAAAWESGAPWVEADTQPTSDGVPVILHDDDLDRTTSGSGPVRRHSFAEVSGLDIVGGSGSGVPSLAALLALMPTGRGVLLEIKGDHSRADVAEILRQCESSGHDDRVFLQSFEHPVLDHLQALAPDRPTGPAGRTPRRRSARPLPGAGGGRLQPGLPGRTAAAGGGDRAARRPGSPSPCGRATTPPGGRTSPTPGWTRSSPTPPPSSSRGRPPDTPKPVLINRSGTLGGNPMVPTWLINTGLRGGKMRGRRGAIADGPAVDSQSRGARVRCWRLATV